MRTFFENCDEVVEFLALDAEEIVDDESPTLLVPADVQIRSLRPRVQQVDDLRTHKK